MIDEEISSVLNENHIGNYETKIDLSGNSKGIYLFVIETENGIYNIKLILQ